MILSENMAPRLASLFLSALPFYLSLFYKYFTGVWSGFCKALI